MTHETDAPDTADPVVSTDDAHGRAALLLIESLIHGLIARSAITLEDAVEIITTAVDVEDEIAAETVFVGTPTITAQTLLETLVMTFRLDLPHVAD